MVIDKSLKLILGLIIPILLFVKLPIRSSPKISGLFDTTVCIYSTENEELSEAETNFRIHEGIILDLDFTEKLSFHINNRITYRSNDNEDAEQYDLNFYYGYLNYILNKNLNMQFGRIMDISNLIFSSYDGGNLEYNFNISKNKITLDFYGGLLVNDDYLEDEEEPRGFNSTDYRNLLIEQRKGDYIGGTKANIFARGIGIFGLDYQMLYNDGSLAEQYVSIDFDTMFSKRIQFYGYGTLDLIESSPSNTLVASRINIIESLSVIIEHEYYRPVYIKDSYFWSYFKPYGSQEISGMVIWTITQLVIVDLKYGMIFYDADEDNGQEISGSFEHRGICNIGVKLNTEYITGPEGDKITVQTILRRRFFSLDAIAGGGVVYYNEDALSDTFSRAYFAMLGADMRIFRSLILSATGEYYNNPKYYYDLRGILSAKYLF